MEPHLHQLKLTDAGAEFGRVVGGTGQESQVLFLKIQI